MWTGESGANLTRTVRGSTVSVGQAVPATAIFAVVDGSVILAAAVSRAVDDVVRSLGRSFCRLCCLLPVLLSSALHSLWLVHTNLPGVSNKLGRYKQVC